MPSPSGGGGGRSRSCHLAASVGDTPPEEVPSREERVTCEPHSFAGGARERLSLSYQSRLACLDYSLTESDTCQA